MAGSLRLIRSMLKAGRYGDGRLFPTERGTPQGGVGVSPAEQYPVDAVRQGNATQGIPADTVRGRLGHHLCVRRPKREPPWPRRRRSWSDWACASIPKKTRIVRVKYGFEFLGYTIKRGKGLRLPLRKIRTGLRSGGLYAYPAHKSLQRCKDQVRRRTRRNAPVHTEVLIQQLNPVLRGWGHYYKRAHVRRLFNQLDRWVVRRVWAHRSRRWRCQGWQSLPSATLYGELGLVNLIGLGSSQGSVQLWPVPWLISQALSSTYVAGEHRLYLERNCRLSESPAHGTRRKIARGLPVPRG